MFNIKNIEKYKRLANFGWKVLAANYKNLNFPIKLNYAVTYRCNQRCLTCNIWENAPDEEMSLKEIDAFFRKNPGFNWIDLTGGEIFLRKDIHEILRIIVSRCKNLYLLHFPTNGSCYKEVIRAIDFLMSSPVPLIIATVSIDGDEETHNYIRGKENAFKFALETFLELRKRTNSKFKVYAGMTISRFNIKRFHEILRKMEEGIPGLTYNDMHLNFAQASTHYYQNDADVLIDPAKQIEIFNELSVRTQSEGRGIIKYLESHYQSLAVEFLKEHKNPAVCQALSCSLFMDPGGQLYPCITWNKRLGKIKDYQYSLDTFLQDPKIMELRKDVIDGRCPNCWTPCEAYQSIMARTAPFSRWNHNILSGRNKT